ncbi:low temperature requirement protein A [Nocardiopsis metallicus]|uniref:Low temperature requirement protein LtrA n=1 Tax=Nocardiopsis metallicus TaxID=179819 RepID=A0A840W5P9_9ACTN|nr:low temperature requirement protein A [Nocardiopsis metallicus]MBB5490673.1 low temperature requirement protein LtrA [Nocardiopsis metallicus]
MGILRDGLRLTGRDASVTPMELFFDLVFVFALIQVTQFMATDLNWHGVLRGMLLVALLWWSWVCFSWVANLVKADEGTGRLAMFVAMASMFVFALAIPEAFDDAPGGLSGPVLVVGCYFVFRMVHLVLFWFVSAGDPDLRNQLWRFLPSMLLATFLLLLATRTEGAAQTALWAVALAADYLGNYIAGSRGWRIMSVGAFAERHGLILIIALGESLLSIGFGVSGLAMTWPIVVAAALGLGLAGMLWRAYFQVSAPRAEHAVAALPPGRRERVARDAYSYLHLPLVAGILLTALGLKKALAYVGDPGYRLADPLTGIPLVVLVGGVVLYLLGQIVFTLRTVGTFNVKRVAAVGVLLVLLALGPMLPILVTLALLTLVTAGVVQLEVRRARQEDAQAHARADTRSDAHGG